MLDPSTVHEPGIDWRTRASCRDVDPEIFFPTAETGPMLDTEVAAARAVCGGCRSGPSAWRSPASDCRTVSPEA